MTENKDRRTIAPDAVLLLLLALSLAPNVWLGIRVLTHTSAIRTRYPEGPVVGTLLPALHARTGDNESQSLVWGSDGRPTVLFLFSPNCPWCTRTWPVFKVLASSTGLRYRFAALSLTEHSEGLVAPFPVYSKPTPDTIRALGLTRVPQTLVVSVSGRVEQVWSGAYEARVRREIRDYFGLHLPEQGQGPSGASQRGSTR